MTPEEILAIPPKVLTDKQRECYFAEGYLLVEKLLPDDWLERLRAATDEMIAQSRTIAASDATWDLEQGHSAEDPRLRRLSSPNDHHPTYWDYASASVLPDVIADLVGPNVKFHSAKLNYKWPGAGEVVHWHQDIQAWPHTNYSPVTLGVYLDTTEDAHGPLLCVPGSHEGPLFRHDDASGNWTGRVSDADLATSDVGKAVALTGGPGTLVAINCRTVHGSRANRSATVRPLLLYVYSSADAFAWMPPPTPTRKTGAIVRGEAARTAHLDPRPCPVPPNWAKQGYGSIFTAQRSEGT